VFAETEINNQGKKNAGFDFDQADLISSNIVQKITNHFALHLKEDTVTSKESLDLINKIFQLKA
jgi:glutamyl-tRNA reductase